MKYKVSELEGPLLDAAVALAEGWKRGNHTLEGFNPNGHGWMEPVKIQSGDTTEDGEVWQLEPRPWSTDWQYGGPIIERERLPLEWITDWGGCWQCSIPRPTEISSDWRWFVQGPTPLIAAMRAHVASNRGDEVDL